MAAGQPALSDITPMWTFSGKWDPEKRIRDLWDVLVYERPGKR